MRILASEPEASKCLIVCVLIVTLYVHIRSIGGGAFPHPRFSEYLYFNINIYNYYIRLDDLPVLVTLVVSISKSIINLL